MMRRRRPKEQETQGETSSAPELLQSLKKKASTGSDFWFPFALPVITLKMPPTAAGASGQQPDGATKPDDYLLSKLPPDGREVPFVLPTFKASYVQPSGSRFPNLPPGPQSR